MTDQIEPTRRELNDKYLRLASNQFDAGLKRDELDRAGGDAGIKTGISLFTNLFSLSKTSKQMMAPISGFLTFVHEMMKSGRDRNLTDDKIKLANQRFEEFLEQHPEYRDDKKSAAKKEADTVPPAKPVAQISEMNLRNAWPGQLAVGDKTPTSAPKASAAIRPSLEVPAPL